MNNIGKLQQTEVSHEMKRAYLDYAMSVIVSRALPDVRDGLKPVHRRILFSMHEMNLTHSAKYVKSAKIVGEVMGKYHPHGDMPIYDALVRLAQDFSMRYPLIDGQGNFGSMDGDPPAAMRYCVSGDTLIVTDKGLFPIKDLASSDTETTLFLSILSKNRVINKTSKWFNSGLHPTKKITTKQGFTLQGSYNHPILVLKKDISGKPVYVWKLNRTVSKITPESLNKDLAFILGSFVSEGSINEDKIEFCNSDKEWIRDFEIRFQKVFPDCRLHKFNRKPSSYGKKEYQRIEIHSHYVIKFLKNLGLEANKSPLRRVPKLIFQSPKEVVATFLQAYFEGDGGISNSSRMIELSCVSTSEKLLHEIQILLLRFGIVATKRFDTYRHTYKLYLRGQRNYKQFRDNIYFVSRRKQNKLNEIIQTLHKEYSILDCVPFLRDYVYSCLDKSLNYDQYQRFVYKHNFDPYAPMLTNYPTVVERVTQTLQPEVQILFRDLLSNNYLFDAVTQVEDGPAENVYSIKIESSCHSFIGNGFINHNTEARMSGITAEMLFDIDKETVNVAPNFDATIDEPLYLPAKLPNLLLMGSEGIAVGMATKIPPHNITEVIEAIIFMIGKTTISKSKTGESTPEKSAITVKNESTIDELLEYIKGPDFPTKGSIYDIHEIKNVYATGRGRIIIRGKAEIEDVGQGKSAIIITELPYQVNKALLVARIADLAKEKKIEGITDLRDESDRHGIRVMVELKRDAVPKKILNALFKYTSLQTIFPANIVALVDGTPQTLNLKTILEEYLKHRYIIVTKRSEFELRSAKARLHILEGLKIAVDHIDAVIRTIRESNDQEEAKQNLITKFKLSEIQAVAILDMQLRRLAALERQKIEDEYAMVKETIAYLEDLLSHSGKILTVIKEELIKLKEKFGDQRRTRVFKSRVGEFSDEDLIQNESTVITLTETGYIKRQSSTSFRTQHRGGKGIIGMTTKEEDSIKRIKSAMTHDNILFFTNKGKVYQLKAHELAESSRTSKGTAIINLLNIETGEKVESFNVYNKEVKSKYVFLTTRKGTVKKTALSEFENIRRNGIVAIKLDKGDELVWSNLTTGEDDIFIFTRHGKAIRFPEKDARPLGRNTMGVMGIKLMQDDQVAGMDVKKKGENPDLLTIMEKGLGKKTPANQFPKQSRSGRTYYYIKTWSDC